MEPGALGAQTAQGRPIADGTPFALHPITMMRKLLLILPALGFGLAEPAEAQRRARPEVAISVHAGAHELRADFGRRPTANRRGRVVSQPQGHWRTVPERIWIPGRRRVVHLPAEYGFRYDSCGRRIRVCIRPARREVIQDPGRYEVRHRRVWVPAPRAGRQHGSRRGFGHGRRAPIRSQPTWSRGPFRRR